MKRPEYVERVATVPFRLPRPSDLPNTVDRVVAADAERAATIQALLYPAAPDGAGREAAVLLERVAYARAELGPAPGEPVGPDPGESPANRDNDLAFGIVRTRGPAGALLQDAVLASLAGVLEMAVAHGSDVDKPAWDLLNGGFEALIGWLARPRQAPVRHRAAHPGALHRQQPDDALRRWVRGHHVFMTFCQGATVMMSCLQHSAELGALEDAAAAAAAAVALMEGSHGALLYAGDARRTQYREEIRPTLMPPVAPPKMSGLHWRDHEALVAAITAARPAWSVLAGFRPDLLDEYRTALDAAYRAHRDVCEQFVGDRSPSLLATKGSSRYATDVLGQFRRIRLRSLPDTGEAREGDAR